MKARDTADVRRLTAVYVLALILFSLLFTGITFHFWLQMSLSVVTLCGCAFMLDGRGMRDALLRPGTSAREVLLLGVASAAVLYALFFAVNYAVRAWLPSGAREIADVYAFKGDNRTSFIVVLIALIIGPGEELFWRGYVQRHLERVYPRAGTALAVAAYASVHLASGNLMLVSAALFCGAFWAVIYRRFGCLWLNVISHVVWDLAIFVFWPLS